MAFPPMLRDQNGNIIPQIWDGSNWLPYTGQLEDTITQTIAAQATEQTLTAIKTALMDGTQKVALTGNNVLIASGADFEVTPGSASRTQVSLYDYKNFTWLYVQVLAQNSHDFEVEQEVTGYTRLKIAGKAPYSTIFLSEPFRPMGTYGRIWISNKSLDPQKYSFQIYGMTG